MKNIKTTLSLMVISALAVPCAFAQSSDAADAGPIPAAWYIGAEAGSARAKIDDPTIADFLNRDGASSVFIHNEDHATGFKVFGGYQFNDYVAIEAGYVDLGKFGYTANTIPAGTLNGNITLRGVNLDVIGSLPITDTLSARARVGMNYTEANDHFNAAGLVETINPDPSKKSLDYKFGLGLEYKLTRALALTLDAERYRVNDAIGNKGDIDLVLAGLQYRFGSRTQMHAAQQSAVPVTAAVAPEPVAAPAAPTKAESVSYKAVSLFEFDKADINAQGKSAIDMFAAELKSTDFDTITVSGHTDRIGTHQYNVDLSQRRADTVKNYLVEASAVPGNKIDAKALDGADPVTQAGQCQGNKVTDALIACLQPDRRVDLEVSGTVKAKP